MTDDELLREALKALKAVDAAVAPTTLGTNELSMVFREARAVAAKLEKRLLTT
jgi:hypothetical protein